MNPVFAFEDLTSELLYPPVAAQRALSVSGIVLSIAVWRGLTAEARRALVHAGAAEQIDPKLVRAQLRGDAVGRMQLRHPYEEPSPLQVPRPLEWVLGPWQPIVAHHWSRMPALHRYVLATLAQNPRLLWRALTEIAQRNRWTGLNMLPAIHGRLARCELRVSDDAVRALSDVRFHGGCASVLARAAGVRAARRIGDLLDSFADVAIGPVELEWGVVRGVGVAWQAHVSTVEGAFAETASLLAASTAGVAMLELVRELDDDARVVTLAAAEEPWLFGSPESEATLAY